jgi:DNA-binding transcriptional LysR family regulator
MAGNQYRLMLFLQSINTGITSIMNTRHLRQFVVLAETLHFGHAAKRLHMTQPPLSRQIVALEASLGIELFSRHSRSVALTPAGESFYLNARRILDEFDFAVRAAQATARGERGELRIGFTMCSAWSIVPELLASFGETYPDVILKLSETLPRDLQNALLSGEVDVGISFPQTIGNALNYRQLFQEPLCAVLPEQHPLVKQQERESLQLHSSSKLAVADLANEQFVMFPASTAPELHAAVLACCHHAGFQPHIRLETHLQQTIVNLVARGLGVSLVPDSMRRMQLQGAVFRTLDYSPAVEQGLFWSEHNRNPCLQPFMELIDQSQSAP